MKKILVPLDTSKEAEAGIHIARKLAGIRNATLLLQHVVECRNCFRQRPTDAFWCSLATADGSKYLAKQLQKLKSEGISAEPLVVEGEVVAQISEAAKSPEVDLVVLTPHASMCDPSATIENISRHVRKSLLIVPGTETVAAKIERIIVLLDGSAQAEAALQDAEKLAMQEGAQIILATALAETRLYGEGVLSSEDQTLISRISGRRRSIAFEYLGKIRNSLARKGIDTRFVISESPDVRRSLQDLVTEQQADFIILSAKGQTASGNLRPGSMAQFFMGSPPVPVLVVSSQGLLPQTRHTALAATVSDVR